MPLWFGDKAPTETYEVRNTMAEPSSQEAARETNGHHEAQARNGFDELRRLLLRPEQQQLSEIETRLQDRRIDPRLRSRSTVIPHL